MSNMCRARRQTLTIVDNELLLYELSAMNGIDFEHSQKYDNHVSITLFLLFYINTNLI